MEKINKVIVKTYNETGMGVMGVGLRKAITRAIVTHILGKKKGGM